MADEDNKTAAVSTSLSTGNSEPQGTPRRCAGCAVCSLASGCLARDLHGAELEAFSALAASKRRLHRDDVLFYAGDSLEALYVVHGGTFKTVTESYEGYPKVTGFYLPGDMMGLEGLLYRQHLFDAVALEDSEVCVLPEEALERMARDVPALWQELLRTMSYEASQDHGLMLLLGSMNADERVATLLLSFSERYHRLGYSSHNLLLHMTREDMASYLGLTNETVCRVMSRLNRNGVLEVHQRHIEFTDARKLVAATPWPIEIPD